MPCRLRGGGSGRRHRQVALRGLRQRPARGRLRRRRALEGPRPDARSTPGRLAAGSLTGHLERCPSGLRSAIGNRVGGVDPSRGFESLPLRLVGSGVSWLCHRPPRVRSHTSSASSLPGRSRTHELARLSLCRGQGHGKTTTTDAGPARRPPAADQRAFLDAHIPVHAESRTDADPGPLPSRRLPSPAVPRPTDHSADGSPTARAARPRPRSSPGGGPVRGAPFA
jgi:hypothetical protein